MPDAPRQLRTDLPGAGPFRAVLWHQDALDEGPFPPEEWLAPEERAEFGSLGSEKRRREWLAARVALKDLLVRDGVVRRPTDAIVRKDDRGAPRLVVWEPDTFRYAELACAISHSAPLVLCAYLRGRGARIGVDVERRSWRLARLGRKFLSPGDRMLEKDDDRGDETVLCRWGEINYEACAAEKELLLIKDAPHTLSLLKDETKAGGKIAGFVNTYFA